MDVDDWVSTLGTEIKKIRLDKGMTQSQLAEKSGVSQGAIAKIEKNMHGLGLNVFMKLLNAMEVSSASFLKQFEQSSKEPVEPIKFTGEWDTVNKDLKSLDRKKQLELAQLISQIIKFGQK